MLWGYVGHRRTEGDWEEKHLLDFVLDLPQHDLCCLWCLHHPGLPHPSQRVETAIDEREQSDSEERAERDIDLLFDEDAQTLAHSSVLAAVVDFTCHQVWCWTSPDDRPACDRLEGIGALAVQELLHAVVIRAGDAVELAHAKFTIALLIRLAVGCLCKTWVQSKLDGKWDPHNPSLCDDVVQTIAAGVQNAAEMMITQLEKNEPTE